MNFQMEKSEPSITSYGVSEQLKAEFEMLRDVQCTRASMKFTKKTVDTLAQHIVCRNYGNLCYEFSHLNWALIYANSTSNSDQNIQSKLINYYWMHQCHWPQHFMDYFSSLCLPNEVTPEQAIAVTVNRELNSNISKILDEKVKGITLNIYAHEFSISASRANTMACFMEWLICIVPNLLTIMEETLHGQGHNAIREFSSFLQKHIYDYLSQHLPPAKLQQRFRTIQHWYSDAPQKPITDMNLLAFWKQNSRLEGYGKFSNVVKDTLAYASALAMVKTSENVQYANSELEIHDTVNGQDSNSADIHFDWVSQNSPRAEVPISRLLDAPKALNKQQVEFIELLARYPQQLLPLTSTWLRLQAFGKVQHQIIQMIRVKDASANDAQRYSDLCQTDYLQIKQNCVRLMASNQQVLLAISQIMLAVSPNQSCLILLKLMPQMPSFEQYTKPFAALLEDSVSANGEISKNLILQWQLSYPWINALFRQTQLALKQINRQGFTSSTLLLSEDYLQCAELIFDLNKLIKQIVRGINKDDKDDLKNFEADRYIFISEFSALYGQEDQQKSGQEDGH